MNTLQNSIYGFYTRTIITSQQVNSVLAVQSIRNRHQAKRLETLYKQLNLVNNDGLRFTCKATSSVEEMMKNTLNDVYPGVFTYRFVQN